VFYITNNSSKSRKQNCEKFKKMGLPAEEEEIISSSYGVAVYLKEQNFAKKAYIVGCDGIAQELKLAGVQAYEEQGNPLPHNKKVFHEDEFAKPIVDPEVQCWSCLVVWRSPKNH